MIFPINVIADSGKSTIVVDNDSGRILYKNNINEKKLIASITKIMTCILVIENVDIDKSVIVGDEVLKMYGTNIYVQVGEKIKIKDLLYGLMLRSGNDAAIVLANNVFESEDQFVDKMNKKAKEIGMKNTHFSNPHGLDDDNENISTAYDMSLLAMYAYRNDVYRKIISTKKYITNSDLKSYEWYNRMSLLTRYKYCTGGKNGYTPKAGKTLVSYARQGNLNLIIVSIDDNDIYENHINLYNSYFDKYSNYTIIDKKRFNIDSSLIHEEVYLKKSFRYPLLHSEVKNVSTIVQVFDKANRNVIGKVIIYLNNNKIGEEKVYLKNKKRR